MNTEDIKIELNADAYFAEACIALVALCRLVGGGTRILSCKTENHPRHIQRLVIEYTNQRDDRCNIPASQP